MRWRLEKISTITAISRALITETPQVIDPG
jgi:hypothetical protein